jgi:hypothetical protein
MPDRFNEDIRRNAVDRARELIEDQGYSQNRACTAVAEDLGLKSPRTIAIWAVDLEQPLPSGADARAKTAKATASTVVYHQLERLGLSDRAFRKLEELLPKIVEAAEMWKWTTAFDILIEKRRLEENKSTANTFVGIQSNEPSTLDELATGTITRQPALPPNVSPLARRQA